MDDDDFVTPNKTTKRHLYSKSDGQEVNKKKSMFVQQTDSPYLPPTTKQILPPDHKPPSNTGNCEEAPIRKNLPPPIIVRGVLDFIGFRDELVRLVGSENFFFKSPTNDLKIQTTKPDHYCVIIHFLKESTNTTTTLINHERKNPIVLSSETCIHQHQRLT